VIIYGCIRDSAELGGMKLHCGRSARCRCAARTRRWRARRAGAVRRRDLSPR
jgi:hypothetical protein